VLSFASPQKRAPDKQVEIFIEPIFMDSRLEV